MSIPWQIFDDELTKYIEEKAKQKELQMIACCFTSFFSDDVSDVCSKCGRIVCIRPAIRDIAKRYKVPIVCMDCADKKEVATATVEALEDLMKKGMSMCSEVSERLAQGDELMG